MKRWTLAVTGLAALVLLAWVASAQPPRGDRGGPPRKPEPREQATFGPEDIARANRVGPDGQTVGLFRNSPQAFPGYTLFAPKHHTLIYLMDNQGQAVHQWKSQYEPGQSVYLLENGHLLHCCFTRNRGFTQGGEGGRLEEFDWEGNLVWEFEYSSDQYLSHHDVKPLPNGNVLMLAVEKKSYDDCLAAGFDPGMLRDEQLFPEFFIEVQPTRPKGGQDRLGVACLGPSDPGQRSRQEQLRQRGGASRVDRRGLQRPALASFLEPRQLHRLQRQTRPDRAQRPRVQ